MRAGSYGGRSLCGVDAAAPEHPHEPLAAPLPGAVLVVDDEPPVRALAETTLRRAGYATTGASDGLEAIEKLTAHRGRFDVIVLDLAMPRLGGAEAFPKLRAICPGVPIVLLSGFAQDTVAHLLEEPAVFFLSKPCRPATLLNLVARAQRLAPRAVHRVPQGADRD